MRISELAWFNGRLVPPSAAAPSVASNTLHLGTSVFDGVMAYWNDEHWYLHLLDEHMARFAENSRQMGLDHGFSASEIAAGIRSLVATLPPATHYIRPIAYRTAAEAFFTVDEDSSSVCVFATPVPRDLSAPYRCQLSPVPRVRGRAVPVAWKVSGAYANSYRAEQEAAKAGFHTGLMLDEAGLVCEASSSNVFFVQDDLIVTPALTEDIFPGLTRALIMRLASDLGLKVEERAIPVGACGEFDAAFLCGTLSEIRPVSEIGDLKYDSEHNPVFAKIRSAFRACTHA